VQASACAQLYHKLTSLVAQANAVDGHYLLLLEGGYDTVSLGLSLANTSAAMLNLPPVIEETLPQRKEMLADFDLEAYVATLNAVHLGNWKFLSSYQT